MPPLDEGSLLYMPSTMRALRSMRPHRLLQITDRVIKQFPEWTSSGVGEGGARAETSDRSGPAFDARDRNHAQAEIAVAQGRHLVLVLGSGLDEVRLRHVTLTTSPRRNWSTSSTKR